jgi:hypothetical protein
LKYGRLSLYSFETTEITQQPQLDVLFSFCKPPAKSDANELYETPALLQREFEATFGRELLARTEPLTQPNTSDRSFILGAIGLALSDQEYNGSEPPRSLIIVSDMMENTPIFSQYSRAQSAMLEPRNVLERYPELFTDIDLQNVDVTIIYLPRDNARRIQGIQHQRFWRDLFIELGADKVTIQRGPE